MLVPADMAGEGYRRIMRRSSTVFTALAAALALVAGAAGAEAQPPKRAEAMPPKRA